MMGDQAARLRALAEAYKRQILGEAGAPAPPPRRRAQVIAVTSGKGGVGKSNIAVNLAYALIARGRRVLLLDADLGLANADILVGAMPSRHLGHFLAGTATLPDLIVQAPGGLAVVPGGSGIHDLLDLPPDQLDRFVAAMGTLEDRCDHLIVDTGAGLHAAVMRFVLAAHVVVLVTTPEPTAVADAYAVLKALVREQPGAAVRLVVNQVRHPAEGQDTADHLAAVARRFLGIHLDHLGSVPLDPAVPEAVRRQYPFFLSAPRSPAARAVAQMAARLLGEPQGDAHRPSFLARLRSLLAG